MKVHTEEERRDDGIRDTSTERKVSECGHGQGICHLVPTVQ